MANAAALLSEPPKIETVELLAAKLPSWETLDRRCALSRRSRRLSRWGKSTRSWAEAWGRRGFRELPLTGPLPSELELPTQAIRRERRSSHEGW